jgi:hypothetical protein
MTDTTPYKEAVETHMNRLAKQFERFAVFFLLQEFFARTEMPRAHLIAAWKEYVGPEEQSLMDTWEPMPPGMKVLSGVMEDMAEQRRACIEAHERFNDALRRYFEERSNCGEENETESQGG